VRRARHQLKVADFIRHFKAGTLPPDAVCLTFDDGDIDNPVTGNPLLAKADVPATVHVITGFLDRPGEFWWDELARLILQGNGPLKLELTIGERPVCFDLAPESVQHDALGNGSTKRRSALRSIWQALRRLGDHERGLVMQTIRSTYPTNDHNPSCSRANDQRRS
jgi:peptidoglycan/xylan/chitin deacetylase (PgdA/CDA1 family)